MGRAVPIRYFLEKSGTGTGPGTQSKKSHKMGQERLQNPGIGRFRDRILVPLNALVETNFSPLLSTTHRTEHGSDHRRRVDASIWNAAQETPLPFND
jgi:hypothetical protein